ncbi:MAG: formylglycine-generating enzyme family protein, partial [Candidatus Competibacteraceae bacterium]|nr:formylglycine-generating enzyme family protein [Candidatus Competibacteraceae bacterium]
MFNMPRPQQGLWLIIILLLILLGLCLGFSFWWGGPTPSTSATSGTPQTSAGNTTNTAAPHVIEQLRDTLTSGDQGPELVLIPAGTFQMGSPDSEPGRYPNERLHTVTIEHTFAISRYEISFDEYALFAQTSGHPLPSDQDWGQKQHPVINVSWLDAMAYTDWLSTQTGQHYRLP